MCRASVETSPESRGTPGAAAPLAEPYRIEAAFYREVNGAHHASAGWRARRARRQDFTASHQLYPHLRVCRERGRAGRRVPAVPAAWTSPVESAACGTAARPSWPFDGERLTWRVSTARWPGALPDLRQPGSSLARLDRIFACCRARRPSLRRFRYEPIWRRRSAASADWPRRLLTIERGADARVHRAVDRR